MIYVPIQVAMEVCGELSQGSDDLSHEHTWLLDMTTIGMSSRHVNARYSNHCCASVIVLSCLRHAGVRPPMIGSFGETTSRDDPDSQLNLSQLQPPPDSTTLQTI